MQSSQPKQVAPSACWFGVFVVVGLVVAAGFLLYGPMTRERLEGLMQGTARDRVDAREWIETHPRDAVRIAIELQVEGRRQAETLPEYFSERNERRGADSMERAVEVSRILGDRAIPWLFEGLDHAVPAERAARRVLIGVLVWTSAFRSVPRNGAARLGRRIGFVVDRLACW